MIIRFKSEEAMNKFRGLDTGPFVLVNTHNQEFVDVFGMSDIKVNNVDCDWWDIVDPNDEQNDFTVHIADEGQYFDIISE